MKILFAECCNTLVVPYNEAHIIRHCACGKACCWWEDPLAGRLVVYSEVGPQLVSVLGLHNDLLLTPFRSWENDGVPGEFGCIQANQIRGILDRTPSDYLFRQLNSLVVRVRPGFSKDIRMATVEELQGLVN